MQVQSKTGGEVGNSRLTSLVGLLLLGLLFLEGLTIPLVHRLLAPHVFIGLLLIPPIALKLGSTGYRFAMYYGGNRRYRAIGPPPFLLRVGAPFLILTTVLVFASGIELLVLGPQQAGIWKQVHVASFLLWFCVMTVHVLAHAWKAGRLGLGELFPDSRMKLLRQPRVGGAVTRRSLIIGSIILGVVLAVALLPIDHSWLTWSAGAGQ